MYASHKYTVFTLHKVTYICVLVNVMRTVGLVV